MSRKKLGTSELLERIDVLADSVADGSDRERAGAHSEITKHLAALEEIRSTEFAKSRFIKDMLTELNWHVSSLAKLGGEGKTDGTQHHSWIRKTIVGLSSRKGFGAKTESV